MKQEVFTDFPMLEKNQQEALSDLQEMQSRVLSAYSDRPEVIRLTEQLIQAM